MQRSPHPKGKGGGLLLSPCVLHKQNNCNLGVGFNIYCHLVYHSPSRYVFAVLPDSLSSYNAKKQQ